MKLFYYSGSLLYRYSTVFYISVLHVAPSVKMGETFQSDYDLCLKIESSADKNHDKIFGKYCRFDIKHLKPEKHSIDTFQYKEFSEFINSKNLTLLKIDELIKLDIDQLRELAMFMYFDEQFIGKLSGICVPSTCSIEEISDSINKCNLFLFINIQIL